MPCGQYPALRHAGVTRQGRDGQGRATRTGRGMAGSGRDGQAPAAAGRIALSGSGGGRQSRPELERGARLGGQTPMGEKQCLPDVRRKCGLANSRFACKLSCYCTRLQGLSGGWAGRAK